MPPAKLPLSLGPISRTAPHGTAALHSSTGSFRCIFPIAVGYSAVPESLSGLYRILRNPAAHGGHQSLYLLPPSPSILSYQEPGNHPLGHRSKAAAAGHVAGRRIVDRRSPQWRWFPVFSRDLPNLNPNRRQRRRRDFMVDQASARHRAQSLGAPKGRDVRYHAACRQRWTSLGPAASREDENVVADQTSPRSLARLTRTTRPGAGSSRSAFGTGPEAYRSITLAINV